MVLFGRLVGRKATRAETRWLVVDSSGAKVVASRPSRRLYVISMATKRRQPLEKRVAPRVASL